MAKIILDNVSVQLPIYSAGGRSLKSKLIGLNVGGQIVDKGHHQSVQALVNLSLSLQDGDRLGIVGQNGAGKTTLLRIMSGVYEPTSGSISREGHIAAMFDITSGMDAESTGYENIILRGLYMGLSLSEIHALSSSIAEFSELGEFLMMPIRTYSAGMYMRLAFSVATSIGSDILLLDEWLSAGDAVFVVKAKARMKEIVGKSNILVLASHDLDLISTVCNKAILLEHGKLRASGLTAEVLDAYKGLNA